MRDQIENIPTKFEEAQYSTQWGVKAGDRLELMNLNPALDISLSRPADAAHSEFNGPTHLIYALLLDLLSQTARKEYA